MDSLLLLSEAACYRANVESANLVMKIKCRGVKSRLDGTVLTTVDDTNRFMSDLKKKGCYYVAMMTGFHQIVFTAQRNCSIQVRLDLCPGPDPNTESPASMWHYFSVGTNYPCPFKVVHDEGANTYSILTIYVHNGQHYIEKSKICLIALNKDEYGPRLAGELMQRDVDIPIN